MIQEISTNYMSRSELALRPAKYSKTLLSEQSKIYPLGMVVFNSMLNRSAGRHEEDEVKLPFAKFLKQNKQILFHGTKNQDGVLMIGIFVHGQKNVGVGTILFDNGKKMKGTFYLENDKEVFQGELILPSGIKMIGKIIDGFLQGEGKKIDSRGMILTGCFSEFLEKEVCIGVRTIGSEIVSGKFINGKLQGSLDQSFSDYKHAC